MYVNFGSANAARTARTLQYRCSRLACSSCRSVTRPAAKAESELAQTSNVRSSFVRIDVLPPPTGAAARTAPTRQRYRGSVREIVGSMPWSHLRTRVRASLGFAAVLTTGATACTLSRDFFGETAVDVADGGDGGELDAGKGVIHCPQGARGPAMVPVDSFCIDRTEVTADEYDSFLDSGPDPTLYLSAPRTCLEPWMTRFEPSDAAKLGNAPSGSYPAIVTWCGAYAYCRFAGKELCGAVDGGPLDMTRGWAFKQSAWARACGRGDEARTYPYGEEFVPDACAPYYDPGANSGDFVTGRRVTAVGSHPRCEGGYPGIFDLVGNAIEWLNGCGMGDCLVAGEATCQEVRTKLVTSGSSDQRAGFRCCSFPAP